MSKLGLASGILDIGASFDIAASKPGYNTTQPVLDNISTPTKEDTLLSSLGHTAGPQATSGLSAKSSADIGGLKGVENNAKGAMAGMAALIKSVQQAISVVMDGMGVKGMRVFQKASPDSVAGTLAGGSSPIGQILDALNLASTSSSKGAKQIQAEIAETIQQIANPSPSASLSRDGNAKAPPPVLVKVDNALSKGHDLEEIMSVDTNNFDSVAKASREAQDVNESLGHIKKQMALFEDVPSLAEELGLRGSLYETSGNVKASGFPINNAVAALFQNQNEPDMKALVPAFNNTPGMSA